MTQHSIEFQFQGEARDALARELGNLLADTLADWPQHTTDKATTPTGSHKIDAVSVAVAALILAVPGAVLATWDLAKRIQLKEKVDRLINWDKEKATTAPQTRMTIHLPNGIVVALDQVKPEDLLNVLAELANKERR